MIIMINLMYLSHQLQGIYYSSECGYYPHHYQWFTITNSFSVQYSGT